MDREKQLRSVINKSLERYQITIEDLHELYPTNNKNVVMIDGVEWYRYFCVPQFYQDEIVNSFERKTKINFGLAWLLMPSGNKDCEGVNKIIDSLALINNRNELLKVWE
jgi:hypothetical protein